MGKILNFNFFILSILSSLQSSSGATGDRILIPGKLDMGKVPLWEKAGSKIPIENQSKDVIEILSVKTACGCSVAKSSTKLIKPGEVCSLDVSLASQDVGTKEPLIKAS